MCMFVLIEYTIKECIIIFVKTSKTFIFIFYERHKFLNQLNKFNPLGL